MGPWQQKSSIFSLLQGASKSASLSNASLAAKFVKILFLNPSNQFNELDHLCGRLYGVSTEFCFIYRPRTHEDGKASAAGRERKTTWIAFRRVSSNGPRPFWPWGLGWPWHPVCEPRRKRSRKLRPGRLHQRHNRATGRPARQIRRRRRHRRPHKRRRPRHPWRCRQ